MKKIAGLTGAFALVAAVTFAQDVSYNFDQQADFTKYKTYKWVTVKESDQLDELTAKQVADKLAAFATSGKE